MKNKYIKRYIYAVTYHLPAKIREDVEKELNGLILDMLERRCGSGEPSESDLKAVLLELGTPEQLAAKYSGDDRLSLISGMYFLVYKRVLSIVIPLAATGVFIGSAINILINEKFDDLSIFIPNLILSTIGGALGGAFQAFAIITFIFAVLERKKVVLNDGDILSSLPQVPKSTVRIKAYEPIMNMIWAILTVVILIGCPEVFGALFTDGGFTSPIGENFTGLIKNNNNWITAFDVKYIHSMWLLPVFWCICQIVREIFKLIDRCYTKRVAVVTAATNIMIGMFMFFFFTGRIMNPVFIEAINKKIPESSKEFILPMLSNANYIILGIALIVLIYDMGYTAYKAWQNAQESEI